jgi:hypothetical protein
MQTLQTNFEDLLNVEKALLLQFRSAKPNAKGKIELDADSIKIEIPEDRTFDLGQMVD